MIPFTFDELPSLVIIRILEWTCTLIFDDVANITPRKIPPKVEETFNDDSDDMENEFYENFTEWTPPTTPSSPFGRRMKQFLHLLLVSRSFYILLTESVRVDYMPIRRKLMDYQITKFLIFLETNVSIMHLEMERSYTESSFEGPNLTDIQNNCGPVWHNPILPTVMPQILSRCGWCDRQVFLLFAYLVPNLATKGLQKTKRNEPGKQHDTRNLSNLLYKERYQAGRGGQLHEFVVGNFQFAPTYRDDEEHTYIQRGLSILSFKNKQLDLQGEEGRYWLWFWPTDFCPYYIIDYERRLVMLGNVRPGESCDLDLRRIGIRID